MNVTPEKTERPVRFNDGSAEFPGRRGASYGEGGGFMGAGGGLGSTAVPRSAPKRRKPGKIQLGRDIKPVKPDYSSGDRVRHFKFGEGTVLDIREGGKDYEVTVDFDGHGVKKMFAGFAKLKKV